MPIGLFLSLISALDRVCFVLSLVDQRRSFAEHTEVHDLCVVFINNNIKNIIRGRSMKQKLLSILLLSLTSSLANAGLMDDLNKSAGGNLEAKVKDQAKEQARAEGNKKLAVQVNKKLLAEGRKNQCSFKSGTDELASGCGKKSKKLANIIIDVKKTLQGQGQTGFKFIVSGHTDSSGDAAKNKELSARRAQVMVKELVANGVSAEDIESVGMGSEQMLVKPDNTPAKKAKNRRYEVQVRF